MALWMTVVLFVLSLFFVVRSAGYFVEFAARIARRFGASEFLIGLTLVAVGTSLPELLNTVLSSLRGANELGFGNILGSNMSNVGLAIGLCILMGVTIRQPRIYRTEAFVMLAVTAAFCVLSLDGVVSRTDGILLFLGCLAYFLCVTKVFSDIVYLATTAEVSYFVQYLSHISMHTVRERYKNFSEKWDKTVLLYCGAVLLSGAVLLVSAQVLVTKALSLASAFGVREGAIGATVLAIGTASPELSVSLASVRKGYHRMLIGNIIGSNIVNVLLIIGLGAIIHPFVLTPTVILASFLPLLAGTLLFVFILLRKWTIPKGYGVLLLLFYGGFVIAQWFL